MFIVVSLVHYCIWICFVQVRFNLSNYFPENLAKVEVGAGHERSPYLGSGTGSSGPDQGGNPQYRLERTI